ncbi:MAG: ATP-binding protein [Candidatus Moraniibacteriota bacterium]
MCDSAPQLLYYIYVPVLILTLILGFLIFLSDKKNLSSRLFFLLSISVSLWIFFTMMDWWSVNPDIVEIFTKLSVVGVIIPAIFLYFSSVFPDGKNISVKKAILIFLPLLPFVLSAGTGFNVKYIDSSTPDCESVVGLLYYLMPVVFLMYCSLSGVVLINKFKDGSDQLRKQIILILFGFVIFVTWATATNVIAPLFGLDELSLFAPIGALVFMSFVAFAIIKYQFLSIKVLLTQALVIGLIIIAGSELLFAENTVNKILILVTVITIIGFGYMLVKSVKMEVQKSEELEIANKEISERKDQLQKISDHLAIANDKLKELDTAKTEFVSIVAHQLQGPPTTVKGYSMLLSEGSYGEMNAEQKDVLQKIFNANEQQIEFVNDLLSVSRLESGRVMFDFDNCQVQEICQEVVDNLFIKAKDKGLYLELIKSDELIPEVEIDRAKIKEAITNLVDNAVKYTKRGGVNISLQICSLKNDKCLPNNHLRITVSDTGIGIPADEMPRMFSKFSRGKDVKRLNAGGTGLGLYVVKMIVEGNHGQVWVDSDGDGKGSRFIVELPIL